jgi:FtsP/CotA-like multicopper oxidase with cupredoxin domain
MRVTLTRRSMLSRALAAGAALVARRSVAHAAPPAAARPPAPATPAALTPTPPAAAAAAHATAAGRGLVVPNGAILAVRPGARADRVYHLTAAPLRHEIAPGLEVQAWGYNGMTPGPVLEATVGERVRIYLTNELPEPTSVHWHAVLVPNAMDGIGGLTQAPIPPGKTFVHEFMFDRAGTFMYHPHVDEMTQIALGMMGMIVVHPRVRDTRRVRDYPLMLHEWKVPVGTRRADPLAMSDFNVLTINGKAFPATQPLLAEVGDLVRIRFASLGPMDHHPMHLHGHVFELVATDGGDVPPSARKPETTVLVPVGSTRTIEFVARAPGDWPLHCHMTHHVMNQMGHGAANLVGADTRGLDATLDALVPGAMTMGAGGMNDATEMRMAQPANSIAMVGGEGPHGMIDMGGMFTLLKVRDHLTDNRDPGWYAAPRDTGPREATPAELARDGIDLQH